MSRQGGGAGSGDSGDDDDPGGGMKRDNASDDTDSAQGDDAEPNKLTEEERLLKEYFSKSLKQHMFISALGVEAGTPCVRVFRSDRDYRATCSSHSLKTRLLFATSN